MNEITRPTYLEIDLSKLKHNLNSIKNYIPNTELMPVIKANAYGTYVNKQIDFLKLFNIVAVANVDEGVELRTIGYEGEIFILNQPYEEEINKIIEYHLTIGLSSKEFLNIINTINNKITVHLEIETGMNRTGIKKEELSNFLSNINENIIVEGIYTHLSSPDIDEEYTLNQINTFKESVSIIKNKYQNIKYIHAEASNAILNFKDNFFNLARPGLILYGYPSSDNTYSKIDIKPIAKLKSKIIFLKEVEEGSSISYGRTYITDKKTKIATIPIGYADGFRRDFSNGFNVLVNGKKAPIIGKVCMDSFMIDVTNIDCKVNDEVIIFDNENIKLEDLANHCNTINYEILSTISSRVPRKFINKL